MAAGSRLPTLCLDRVSTARDADLVRLRELTLVEETDCVVVGHAESGTYVAVPPIGALIIRAFQRGATLSETADEASRSAGEPVDVEEFVAALVSLGFVADCSSGVELQQTAPIQQGQWLSGMSTRSVRALFSRPVWMGYTAAVLFVVACVAFVPHLRPHPDDIFVVSDAGVSLLIVLPFTYVMKAVHELWHWLAARSIGVSARFGVDRRLYFLVFETDLSQLWGVPRRHRYGPQLAGLAIDSVMLAALLAVGLVGGNVVEPGFGMRLAAALAFVVIASMLWQCMVFLRTDLYGVLVTALNCQNLWRVKSLLLRRAFGRLTPPEAAELDASHPRDIQVGLWFRWVCAGGTGVAAVYFVCIYGPILGTLMIWTVEGLGVGPATGRFWLTLVCSILAFLPPIVVAVIYLRGLVEARVREQRPAM